MSHQELRRLPLAWLGRGSRGPEKAQNGIDLTSHRGDEGVCGQCLPNTGWAERKLGEPHKEHWGFLCRMANIESKTWVVSAGARKRANTVVNGLTVQEMGGFLPLGMFLQEEMSGYPVGTGN